MNAIAPKSDLTKIGRSQFASLFRVADTNKRGLVSWDDFVVFETILKRPDADYWIAFQYFDVYALSLEYITSLALTSSVCVVEITRVLSPTTNSKTSSNPRSLPTPFLLILTGEQSVRM